MPKNKNSRFRSAVRSALTARTPTTKVWQIQAQQMPAFNNTLKKDNSAHHFIQTQDYGTILTTSNTVPTFTSKSFTFNDVQQVASFQALFDQYRIDEVEAWIAPVKASAADGNNANWYSVVDYDDAATPTGLGSLQQYTNVITTPMTNGHYIRFKPHVAESLYSGTFTSFGNIKAPWIDSASPGVQHYGLKMGFNVTPTALAINLIVRLHFSCRNTF